MITTGVHRWLISDCNGLIKCLGYPNRNANKGRCWQISLGYVGHARLEAEDTEITIYSYTGENWNVRDEEMRKRLESTNGQITIDKSCLMWRIAEDDAGGAVSAVLDMPPPARPRIARRDIRSGRTTR